MDADNREEIRKGVRKGRYSTATNIKSARDRTALSIWRSPECQVLTLSVLRADLGWPTTRPWSAKNRLPQTLPARARLARERHGRGDQGSERSR